MYSISISALFYLVSKTSRNKSKILKQGDAGAKSNTDRLEEQNISKQFYTYIL